MEEPEGCPKGYSPTAMVPWQALCRELGHHGDPTGRDSPLWEGWVRWDGMGASSNEAMTMATCKCVSARAQLVLWGVSAVCD